MLRYPLPGFPCHAAYLRNSLHKESGVVTNSYSATLDLPEAREISALPVVIEFNGDSLKIDGYFFSDESPAMVYLDYANGVTHDITVVLDGYEKTVVSSVSCLD